MKPKLSLAIPPFEKFKTTSDLDEHLKRIAKIGYSAVEPLIGILYDDSVETYSKVYAPLLNKYNLGISAFRTGKIHAELGWGFSHPEREKRKSAENAIDSVIRLAGEFPGAKIYNGLIQGLPISGSSIEEAKEYVFSSFLNCLETAEKENVDFCIEAVNRYELSYNNTLSEVSAFLRRLKSGKAKLLIDTFHMNIEESDLSEAIKSTGEHIGGVHFMDSNRLPPGYGHLDLAKIFNTLIEIGYKDYFTVEMVIPAWHENFYDYAETGYKNCMRIAAGVRN